MQYQTWKRNILVNSTYTSTYINSFIRFLITAGETQSHISLIIEVKLLALSEKERKKKLRGFRSGNLAGQATSTNRPITSLWKNCRRNSRTATVFSRFHYVQLLQTDVPKFTNICYTIDMFWNLSFTTWFIYF